MKKSLVLGAAVAALSISASASALNAAAFAGRTITATGFGAVGVVNFVLPTGPALGVNACGYTMLWRNPLVPGDVSACQLREAIGVSNPSCNDNKNAFINSELLAGDGLSACVGYDFLGNKLQAAAAPILILHETSGGTVSGIMFSTATGVLPVTIA